MLKIRQRAHLNLPLPICPGKMRCDRRPIPIRVTTEWIWLVVVAVVAAAVVVVAAVGDVGDRPWLCWLH